MRVLLSLLFVVLVLYLLARLLLGTGTVNRNGSASSQSDAVGERLDDFTRQYQQQVEKSLKDAGTGQ